jgi:hypothetical protein
MSHGASVLFEEFEMFAHILGLAISALILAGGAVGASAQERITTEPDQHQAQFDPSGEEGAVTIGQGGMMGRGDAGGMMGRGMGGNMTGHSMMGGRAMGPPIMFRMMFALMDGDGDGAITLQEFQAAHDRIFKAMDSSKDGRLTQEEMQAFMHGSGKSAPQ